VERPNESKTLKRNPTSIPIDIFVVEKIHIPPIKARAAHTANITKKT
jgi:hypothetical protein